MKKCNTELMKELKGIQQQISLLYTYENDTSKIIYTENEKKFDETDNKYNYEEVRTKINELQEEERKIKAILALSNATTIVDGYDITIAEALVYLAQLSKNKRQLDKMASRPQVMRKSGYHSSWTQIDKALYDVEKAQNDLDELTEKISKLQIAIDRTNLNNFIEV